MGHTLRFVRGDKRNPTETLNLAETAGTGHIFLRTGGFNPGPGSEQLVWAGRTGRRDGQRLLGGSRDNVSLSLTYDLRGGSGAELAYYQREVGRFLRNAFLHETDRSGEDIWLEYRWADGLNDLPAPVFGQLSYYYRVLAGNVLSWPTDLHSGKLAAGEIEGVVANLVCEPYAEGLTQACGTASGTITNEDNGTGIAASASITHTLELDATLTAYTIAGWITTGWASTVGGGDFSILDQPRPDMDLMYSASQDWFSLVSFTLPLAQNGTVKTFAAGANIHLAITHAADDTYRLFVNGVLDSESGPVAVNLVDGDTLVMSGTSTWDGWRVFDQSLTATQVATMYANELPIKTASGCVGPIPYIWTKDGDNAIDNCDGALSTAAKDNWFVVGGVAGDVAAKTRWEIDPATSGTPRVFWLGRKAELAKFTPADTHWLDFSGVTDTGASSGDAYESATLDGSGSDTHDFDAALNEIAFLRGRVRVLGRFRSAEPVNVAPYFRFGLSDRILSDEEAVVSSLAAANDLWILRDFGDLFVDWPQTSAPPTMTAGLLVTETAAVSYELLTNLAAYWKLNETSGTRKDVVGSVDLTDNNTVTYDTGKQNNAAKFTAANSEYLSVADNATMSGGDRDFSFSVWVKLATKTANMGIVRKGTTSGNNEYKLYYNQSDDRFIWVVTDSSGGVTSVKADVLGSPSTGTWYHIICYHDAANDVIGIVVNGGAANTAAHTTGVRDSNGNFLIGVGAATDYFDGLIDELGLWTEVLSTADIAQLYNGGYGVPYDLLGNVVHLDFLQLLPYPNCRVECEADTITIASGDTLVIEGTEAWMEDASDSDSQLYWFEHRGDDVTVEPNRYNYVFALQGEDNEAFTVSLTAAVAVYITPRWTLPGGAVA